MSDNPESSLKIARHEQLDTLLKKQPREVLGVIAAREALRVVPLLAVDILSGNRKIDALPDDFVQAIFDLTPAEARIASSLVSGRSIEEIASDQSISRNTVRTHLRGIMEKTGCNRQAELVALLSGLFRQVEDTAREGLPLSRHAAIVLNLTSAIFRAGALARIVAILPTRAKSLSEAMREADSAVARAQDALFESIGQAGARVFPSVAATNGAIFAPSSAALFADARLAIAGVSAAELASSPLWSRGSTPRWAIWNWQRLQSFLSLNEDWDVWIKWYEDLLAGEVQNEQYELVFASVPNEVWDRGPAEANRWIKEHLPKKTEAKWAATLSTMTEAPLGQRWAEKQGLLVIDARGVDSDLAAAKDVATKNLHELVQQKARAFAARCTDFDDHYGWEGFEAAAARLRGEVDRDISEIPSRIVFVYDACAVLGGFLDQDNRLREQRNSNIAPLDADLRREFFDLIRTAAPWVRSFPTARELDDQAGAYLARRELFEPATTIINSAGEKGIISEHDRAIVVALIKTLEQEGFLSGKAHARGLLATKGMVLKAFTLVAAFYSGAISSDFATRSILVRKIGTVMAAKEEQVIKLLEDAPHDIRLAVKAALEELKRNPPGSAKH